jgi:hypothetical protein
MRTGLIILCLFLGGCNFSFTQKQKGQFTLIRCGMFSDCEDIGQFTSRDVCERMLIGLTRESGVRKYCVCEENP